MSETRKPRQPYPGGPCGVEADGVDGGAGSLWRVSKDRVGDALVVRVAGEIDLDTAPKLQQVLTETSGDGPIVIEFSGVEYFDLAGVHVLETLYAQSDRKGLVVLAGLPPQVRRILDLVGLTRSLRVAGTVDEAIGLLGRRGGSAAGVVDQ